ncbi:alpha/beta hydrolase [Candidatus Synechococcus calcipolaris G9]|uniref:Alpha/beta hydrolase n=1 Tax=Candidatus Synechococcus calcipolaris G9 TaxID=1497997 RepID=A0ABT6F179_9SYNE|nr:alpha/beta hydrolase [Candidatus Synechococcus calcipolaris]MDG2991582.1 alpha/beta hydrolase [Candidatus Synechococcus calcipolaris G9]
MSDPDTILEVIGFPQPPQADPPYWLILLHGWGANAADLLPLVPLLAPDGQGFTPNAPFPHPLVPGGRMWYELNLQEDGTVRDPHGEPPREPGPAAGDEAPIDYSCRLLEQWLTTQDIDLSRTILGGFSQGGVMTLEVGLKYPFAGLVVFSGYWLRSLPRSEPSPPILMIHGNQDPVIPVQAAQDSRDRLNQAGFKCTYRELTMGHTINDQAIALAYQFIKTHKKVHK